MAQQKREPRELVKYDLVELDAVPRKMGPQARQWKEILEFSITTGKAAYISDLGGRTVKTLLASVTSFVARRKAILRGGKLRTRQSEDGGVWIWVEPRKTK